MATLSLSAISVAMSLILSGTLTDQFRRDVPLLHLLDVETDGNAALTWNPKFEARSAGGAYAEGADMADSDFDSHTRVKATLNWAEYRAGAKVSGLAQSTSAAGNYIGGDVFTEELIDAIDKVALDLGTDLYAGDPTASPVELAGAAVAIDGSAGTFAGLATATYGDWVAGEDSIASADLSFENLRTKLHRPVKDATGRDPDFVTCPGAVWDQVKGLFDDKAEVVNEIRVNGRMLDIRQAFGGKAIEIDGVPYIEDRLATASTLYAWQPRFVKLVQVPARKPGVDPTQVVAAIKMLTGLDVNVTDVEARLRQMQQGGALVPFVEMLAQTGDAYKCMVKVYCQVKWRRRNAFAKLVLT